MNRHLDGNTYHKLGYSLGEWTDHYIMYVGHRYEDWEEGAVGLLAKQLAVEEGRLRPTLDRWKPRG